MGAATVARDDQTKAVLPRLEPAPTWQRTRSWNPLDRASESHGVVRLVVASQSLLQPFAGGRALNWKFLNAQSRSADLIRSSPNAVPGPGCVEGEVPHDAVASS